MRRNVIIGLIVLGVLCVVLMITVSWNGSQLDLTRQQRDDLQLEVDDLNEEVDSLLTERDDLQKKLDDHLTTIEQLKSKAMTSDASEVAVQASETP